MSIKKLEIQTVAEKILAKHNIDPAKDFYLKLPMSPYQDLVLERNGNIIFIGHYREEGGDLISDPVLATEDINGYCHPVHIEQWCGDTICSFREEEKLIAYPNRIKEFKSFQRMFAKNISDQGWLEDGIKVETE